MSETHNAEWLRDRFQLFEKYCLPSIVNQTVKNFKWIVLFDQQTPQEYDEKIKVYKRLCPMFVPYLVPSEKGRFFLSIFRQIIAEDLEQLGQQGEKVEKVITTYFDNDDALHQCYVERVQALAPSLADKTYITFYYGLQYYVDMNIATRVRYKENHFNSFVEIPGMDGKVITTFGCSHAHIFKEKKKIHSVISKDEPMWIEVIHSRNVINDVLLRRRTSIVKDRQFLHDAFHIDVLLHEKSERIFYTSFLWRMIKAYKRYAVRRLKRKRKRS